MDVDQPVHPLPPTGSIASLLDGPPSAAVQASLASRVRRVTFEDACQDDEHDRRPHGLRPLGPEFDGNAGAPSIIRRMLCLMKKNPDRVFSSTCFGEAGISLHTAAQSLTRLAKQQLIEPAPCPADISPRRGGRPKRFYRVPQLPAIIADRPIPERTSFERSLPSPGCATAA